VTGIKKCCSHQRLNLISHKPGFNFNQYLLVDDEPLLFHTGPRQMFPLVREAIAALMPVQRLRYVGFSHVESDECGALNLLGRDCLYGRHWGADADYHSLHFELCFYQGIAYCLRHGLQRFEPGAGGEHKIARGFTPTIVHSAHWIADPAMRKLIGRHLDVQGDAVANYRDQAAAHLPFRCEN